MNCKMLVVKGKAGNSGKVILLQFKSWNEACLFFSTTLALYQVNVTWT